jgi:hypothetical protein
VNVAERGVAGGDDPCAAVEPDVPVGLADEERDPRIAADIAAFFRGAVVFTIGSSSRRPYQMTVRCTEPSWFSVPRTAKRGSSRNARTVGSSFMSATVLVRAE